LNIVCLHFFIGKNPKYKKWFDGSPEAEIAVIQALTQGIGHTSILFFKASTTKTYQGSEIQGVHASLMRATFFPNFSSSIILSIFGVQE
jgi:hypothetical protein